MYGYDSKQIAEKVKVPLSTIQKRIRRIFDNGLISVRKEPNYKKLGFKTGIIYISINTDSIYAIAGIISKIDGVYSVSLHTGNPDILVFFLYKNTKQLIAIISEIKRIEGIARIAWSEEVIVLPAVKKENILSMHSELK